MVIILNLKIRSLGRPDLSTGNQDPDSRESNSVPPLKRNHKIVNRERHGYSLKEEQTDR